MDSWSIRFTNETGERITWLHCMPEREARELARTLPVAYPGEFGNVEAFDRLAELRGAFPLDAKVRHKDAESDQHLGIGVVTGCWRVYSCPGDPAAYRGDSVEVRFSIGTAEWSTNWIDLLSGGDRSPHPN